MSDDDGSMQAPRPPWPGGPPRLRPLATLTLLALAALVGSPALGAGPPDDEALAARAREVVDTRCAVCHACYDAPCQLNLTRQEGLERGASREPVYYARRLAQSQPSRLGIDAHGAEAWRTRGFFPVLGDPARGRVDLVATMLMLGTAHPPTADAPLPEHVPLDITRELVCPDADSIARYAAERPWGGMPYASAALADEERDALLAWLARGAPDPAAPAALDAELLARLERWEGFLNGSSSRERLVARYLYEHWFLAHLTFPGHPSGPYFRLVRSRAAPGQPISEIATRRPTDDPGDAPFWYRLQRIDETIVHKTHIVYPLGEAKLARLRALFLETEWESPTLPGYEPEVASNPFVAFAAIPARSRYQFLLDDARMFIMTFIRGPVCRGQAALDVIQDRFHILFLDPEQDVAVTDPAFLAEAAPLLALPAELGGELVPGSLQARWDFLQARYLDLRERAVRAQDPGAQGPTLDFLWDGGGEDPDAYLTVLRHFDNASVVHGRVGAVPKTSWVLDYPIFERIYYDLVAGFDVFGNVKHQVATRLYMDQLRIQAENHFLAFLPPEERGAIRASWYEGARHSLHVSLVDAPRDASVGTRVDYGEGDAMAQLLDMASARLPWADPGDPLNRCAAPPCPRRGASRLGRVADEALRPLSGPRGGFVTWMPGVVLLRVRSASGESAVYTVLRDRDHTNVAFVFGEEMRLRPERDRLTVVPGFVGSYPDFVFDVREEDLAAFVGQLQRVADPASLGALVQRFGVRRTSPRFWPTIDALHEAFRSTEPVEAGLLDLNRYDNL